MKTLIKKICALFSDSHADMGNSLDENSDLAGDRSPLSDIRESITISERVLFQAEKNYRRVARRYSVGKADKDELVSARDMLTNSRAFFIGSLRDLQAALDRNLQRRAA